MHVVSFLLIFLSLSCAFAQEAALSSTSMSLKPDFKAETPTAFTELYSENSYRPDYDSLTTDTRIRYERPVLFDHLKAYVGASIERDLDENAKLKFIANAVSPQVGLLYQPLSAVTLWAEYRQRYQESLKDTKPSGESDPRLGFSTGYFGGKGYSYFEAYGEAILIPRLSSAGVFSGYLRPFLRQQLSPLWNADLYTELYGYSSPTADMGPSRTQARLGGRLGLQKDGWQSSLLVYKPWNIRSSLGTETQLEALLVVGGVF